MDGIKKFVLFGISALLSLAAIVSFAISPAQAAAPNNQGCLGEDVSGYARGGSLFGALVSFLAMISQGFRDIVQAHLAGLVPR